MDNVNPGSKKILVVDDEGDLLKLVKTRLEANGYKVTTLSSGKYVIETAKSEMPDIILLDVVMPGKNGCDVCRELKADEALRRIPVILFTAHYPEEEHLKLRSGEIGAEDYILKPFDAKILLAKIKSLVK
jgi:two-component system alkaline phosphatase synthesis response regulator PhoP